MFRFRFSLALFAALAVAAHPTRAQQPLSDDQIPLAPPALVAHVESAGGKLRLNLANTDARREFRGTAHVAAGSAERQVEAAKVAVALLPGEERLFPLNSAAGGDQYTLKIYDQTGTLILYKNAPVKRALEAARPPAAPATSAAAEAEVQARLAGGETENDPFLLVFEVASPMPLSNASFSVDAKGFQQRKPVNVHGRASVEFKLPPELEERKIVYSLADATGRVVASGEVELDQLLADDHISVGEVKLDKPAYAPGEAAHLVIELQGGSKGGYRLEVAVKQEAGAVSFRDTRKGQVEGGRAIQEFGITLPREGAGPVVFEFKVYDGETGTLLDSGEREIPMTSTGGGRRPGL